MAKMITKTLDDKTLATLKDSSLEKLLPHASDTLSYSLNNGLLFLITSKSKKSFALRYLFKEENGKSAQNLFRFGSFPAMTLNEARVEAERLKELAAQVGNLSRYFKGEEQKKLLEQEIESKSPFSAAVAHYFEKNKKIWSEKTYKVELGRASNHLTSLYHININDLDITHFVKAFEKAISENKIETAKKSIGLARRILQSAFARGIFKNETHALSLLKKLEFYDINELKRGEKRHFFEKLVKGETERLLYWLYSPITYSRCTAVMVIALQLMPRVFLRVDSFLSGKWEDVDFDAKTWRISAQDLKFKDGYGLIVPLSTQSLALLKELHRLTGDKKYMFYNHESGEPISDGGMLQNYAKLGYFLTEKKKDVRTFVTHGFRGLFNTLTNHVLKYPYEYIKLQLHHAENDKIKKAYNEIDEMTFLEERTEMMQRYSDYLDELRKSHNPESCVIPYQIIEQKQKDEIENAEKKRKKREDKKQARRKN